MQLYKIEQKKMHLPKQKILALTFRMIRSGQSKDMIMPQQILPIP
jgi:hypothetical protein